jgi:hypothetical protein
MKIKIKKSKPIAKALIIKSNGPIPLDSGSSLKSIMGSPIGNLMSSIMTSGMPKLPSFLDDMPMASLKMPKPIEGDPEHDDRHMVLSSLRSMRAIIDELEQRACGCDPMPSWAEAKIYAAQKDILTVLGALMGRED